MCFQLLKTKCWKVFSSSGDQGTGYPMMPSLWGTRPSFLWLLRSASCGDCGGRGGEEQPGKGSRELVCTGQACSLASRVPLSLFICSSSSPLPLHIVSESNWTLSCRAPWVLNPTAGQCGSVCSFVLAHLSEQLEAGLYSVSIFCRECWCGVY